jgi:hypothetical protein
MIDMEDWLMQLKRLLDLGDRHINLDPHPDTGQLFINYYNLPEATYCANAGGGAENNNNRIMLTVLFPGKHGWYDKPVAEGMLRVSLAVLSVGTSQAFRNDYKLRGKTCAPEKMAEYIATYLNKVARQVPPKYTHSKPPIT